MGDGGVPVTARVQYWLLAGHKKRRWWKCASVTRAGMASAIPVGKLRTDIVVESASAYFVSGSGGQQLVRETAPAVLQAKVPDSWS